MKKAFYFPKYLVLISLMAATQIASAQDFVWAKAIGGTDSDYSNSVTTDDAGNIYTTGHFAKTVDFDPSVGMFNLSAPPSIFINKVDNTGNLIWAKQIGGPAFEVGNAITADAFGNIYTSGHFRSSADFDPGTGTASLITEGLSDVFFIKMDTSGNFIWAKSIGGTGMDICISITTDAIGNIYATGYFNDTVDFDPGPGVVNKASAGMSDIFVVKLDSAGNMAWIRSFGGKSSELGYSIATDISGNVYATGYFQDTMNFGVAAGINDLVSAGDYDIFIIKLDSLGNFIWANRLGGIEEDIGKSILIDTANNIYLAGTFETIVDFDPSVGVYNLSSNGNQDVFISKIDTSGSFVWAKSMGGPSGEMCNDITADDIGNIYITGAFNGTVDFDPGAGIDNHTAVNNFDAFLSKFDPVGNFVWAKSYNGTSNSINIDNVGNIYTTGNFVGVADFDPGPFASYFTSKGNSDVFINKFSCGVFFGTDVQVVCNSYTWIDGNTYTANNNTATYNIVNGSANGCDSLVTLDLTILSSSIGTDIQTACNSFTWIDNNTYTASNNSATFNIANGAANGCDSLVNLDLTIINIDTTVSISGRTFTSNAIGANYQWIDCGNGGIAIAGATNKSYTATANGNYAVIVTQNGCVDTSGCYAIINVGLTESSLSQISIYPNPTNRVVVIDISSYQGEKIDYILSTAVGKIVKKENNLFGNSIAIDLGKESQGLYFLTIKYGNNIGSFKIVKW